jgi:hypothetical protein
LTAVGPIPACCDRPLSGEVLLIKIIRACWIIEIVTFAETFQDRLDVSGEIMIAPVSAEECALHSLLLELMVRFIDLFSIAVGEGKSRRPPLAYELFNAAICGAQAALVHEHLPKTASLMQEGFRKGGGAPMNARPRRVDELASRSDHRALRCHGS